MLCKRSSKSNLFKVCLSLITKKLDDSSLTLKRNAGTDDSGIPPLPLHSAHKDKLCDITLIMSMIT